MNFSEFIKGYETEEPEYPIDDLANDIKKDATFPHTNDLKTMLEHVLFNWQLYGASDALIEAYGDYLKIVIIRDYNQNKKGAE